MTTCLFTSRVNTLKSIRTVRSTIGMIKNIPGPFAPLRRPRRKMTTRSYSRTIFIAWDRMMMITTRAISTERLNSAKSLPNRYLHYYLKKPPDKIRFVDRRDWPAGSSICTQDYSYHFVMACQLPNDFILQIMMWSLHRSSHEFLHKSSDEAVHILSLPLPKF